MWRAQAWKPEFKSSTVKQNKTQNTQTLPLWLVWSTFKAGRTVVTGSAFFKNVFVAFCLREWIAFKSHLKIKSQLLISSYCFFLTFQWQISRFKREPSIRFW
jgi:hypothetical protein